MIETNNIICDDCLKVMKTFKSESVDLILTDIPYGINYKSNKQNYDTRGKNPIRKNRNEYFKEIEGDEELPVDWLSEAYRVLKNNSAIYVFCHWSKWHILFNAVSSAGFKNKNMIVLNKSNHGMGDLKGSYAPKHELLLFATKGRHILSFPNKRQNDVWEVPVRYSGAKRFHPNEKPVSWLSPCIENSSNQGDVVLDPFSGSGSTGVICKELNRDFILIDIDPQHCKVAKQRLNNKG